MRSHSFERVIGTLLEHFPEWELLSRDLPESAKWDWCEVFDKVRLCDAAAAARRVRLGELPMRFEDLPEALYEASEIERVAREQREAEAREAAAMERQKAAESWESTCLGAYQEILRRIDEGGDPDYSKYEVSKSLRSRLS